ncbi:unconventional myosin IC isoform X3 [Leptopilina heterotoma]|uniref:unconventional myosin IC isoform X3 n=1 Tax=Leptopilina heterotoma TaxID=63436 RepID=UPI001CA8ED9F|nr:unconventional myosin IC isoform X3 [Leptopilina heterotoma]
MGEDTVSPDSPDNFSGFKPEVYPEKRQSKTMERGLHERDRVGVQDFVLLEDYESEAAFIENLRRRFRENLIYTYIGQVLVSVNPYKKLPIYDQETIEYYQRRNFFETPPHIFALADTAYQSLTKENHDQCILISGESGSGKTEASKKILEFIAAATGHKKKVEAVNVKLIGSNPVLEAFGNAKTNRNDNSSRFGKYMDIQFDFHGDPVGGNILNYLLEKSRVVHQSTGERNFHIFYQLLSGANDDVLRNLYLKRNLDTYYYLSSGTKGAIDTIDDASQYREVIEAMKVMEISQQEQDDLFAIVASVLHVGNVGFTETEGVATILKPASVEAVSKLLGCDGRDLAKAFTHRTIDAHGDVVITPLNRELAIYARDALAKAVYDRLFTWLVTRLNKSLQPLTKNQRTVVMGILDIYGFEIFQKNSFEQFCINFCNEKLQQLFIQLTLKSEQEEYLREGIEWEHIHYFNNKVICDLIEEKYKGIISLMDEECLRPGDPTDMSFLEKLNSNLNSHPHYISHMKADIQTQKIMGRDEFRLVHYAGDVTYNVRGFLEKNNDLLFRDLREVMSHTTNSIIKTVFDVKKDLCSKKRPETAITQFKNSLNNLVDILMGKEPSYVRCIKPNDFKMSNQFNDKIVLHQVKYLGLMENLRVRRAGFAYRKPYEQFLQRYKSLCSETWPHYDGTAKDGVQTLVRHLGYDCDDYRMGNTKLFIRFPKTLFETEDAFQMKKHEIIAIIQSKWKGLLQRRKYLEMRKAAITIQKNIRRWQAKREAERRRKAVIIIRRFINGFITRNGSPNGDNEAFIELAKCQWLIRLSKKLPKNVLDNSWMPCPHTCREASEHLRHIHKRWLARKYRLSLSKADKEQFELKILAEKLFKNKKKSYARSLGPKFEVDRLGEDLRALKQVFVANIIPSGESIMYATPVIKYDRHGYKPRERVLILTEKAVYILDTIKTFKLKHRLPYKSIEELVVTAESDNLLIVRIPADSKKDKGDLILEVPHIIEALTKAIDITSNPEILNIVNKESVSHKLVSGKEGIIEFKTGSTPAISKCRQNGHLLVVSSVTLEKSEGGL